MKITFEVPGRPHGKQRARVVYNAKINKTIAYTPSETLAYENLIKAIFMKNKPANYEIMKDGVSLDITAFFIKAKSNKMIYPCLKCDIDNIFKCVSDALNGIAYIDDKQIVKTSCYKLFGNSEKIIVTVEDLSKN